MIYQKESEFGQGKFLQYRTCTENEFRQNCIRTMLTEGILSEFVVGKKI